MSHSTEWSCSEWIASDDLFLRIGHYWYPLHLDRLMEALRKVVDCIMQNLMDCLPNICIARADDDAEQYEMQLRTRWKPVRYIRASDRRTDSYAINTIRKIKKEQRRRRR